MIILNKNMLKVWSLLSQIKNKYYREQSQGFEPNDKLKCHVNYDKKKHFVRRSDTSHSIWKM